MKNYKVFSIIMMVFVMAIGLSSCKKDDPAPVPTVRFLADINAENNYIVDITLDATDAKTFAWDYGDGNTSTEAASHSYTYEAAGEYTITVEATGDGGAATHSETVTIVASIEDLIAGIGDGGKTWVLTQTEADFAGQLGAGPVANDLPLIPEMSLVPSGMLNMFGLGAEYTDEFTFYKDGSFTIDVKNAQALAGMVYGNTTNSITTPSSDPNLLPLCAVQYANVADGTWALNYDDLTVKTFNEFASATMEDIVFTFGGDGNVGSFSLSPGAYLGFTDLTYPAIPELGIAEPMDNSFYIIKDVTAESMNIAIGICGVPFLDAEGNPVYDQAEAAQPIFMYPTFMLHLTFVPKDM